MKPLNGHQRVDREMDQAKRSNPVTKINTQDITNQTPPLVQNSFLGLLRTGMTSESDSLVSLCISVGKACVINSLLCLK